MSPESTKDSTPSRRALLTIFERRQQAHDNLDATQLASDYAETCVVESPTGGRHQGRAAIEEVYRSWFDAFVDLRIRSERLIIDGAHVAQLLTVEGTDIGGFLGLPATHKSFRMPVVFLYEFDGEQIVHEQRIYDFTGLLVQIGVLKAKPA